MLVDTQVTPPLVLSVLSLPVCGSGCIGWLICRAAAHLDEVTAGGAGLEGLIRGNWAVLDKLFK